ncbi:hypothetical protein [Acinetobacter bereziniae]|uniref:hypothetical protein n=1 Tax=Acinetobacter bereziniae TaxID=106648 RepID=UPI00148EA00C|nr:hypothetical protein [Acinetobacter bereziniae]
MKYAVGALIIIVLFVGYFINKSNKEDMARLKQAEVEHKQRLEQNKIDEENTQKRLENQKIEFENARKLKIEQDKLNIEKSLKDSDQAQKDEAKKQITKIEDKIKSEAFDPSTVLFRNQKGICGEVNAKNRFGGYIGFKRYIYDAKLDFVRIEGDAIGYTSPLAMNVYWEKECI